MKKKRHIPQRMCVACRQSQDKKGLIRLVRTEEGVVVDESGKIAGRGAYLHADPICWEKGIDKSLARALNTEINGQNREELISYQEIFTAEESD